jgi:hypothetical protein
VVFLNDEANGGWEEDHNTSSKTEEELQLPKKQKSSALRAEELDKNECRHSLPAERITL